MSCMCCIWRRNTWCLHSLRKNLDASNVFSILPHAQKFEDKDFEDRCWEVVEVHTEEALASDDFVMAERSLVESVVKRDKLNVKEVELFKAVNRWAEKKIEEQGIASSGNAKRRIIGEEIVKEIRFPLLTEKQFVSVAIDDDKALQSGTDIPFAVFAVSKNCRFKASLSIQEFQAPVGWRCVMELQ